MGGYVGFFVAVAAVSSLLFLLMQRADRASERRRACADCSLGDTGSVPSGNDGFSLLGWFVGSSSASPSGDACALPSASFSDSGDTSCGSDGGGGGD